MVSTKVLKNLLELKILGIVRIDYARTHYCRMKDNLRFVRMLDYCYLRVNARHCW